MRPWGARPRRRRSSREAAAAKSARPGRRAVAVRRGESAVRLRILPASPQAHDRVYRKAVHRQRRVAAAAERTAGPEPAGHAQRGQDTRAQGARARAPEVAAVHRSAAQLWHQRGQAAAREVAHLGQGRHRGAECPRSEPAGTEFAGTASGARADCSAGAASGARADSSAGAQCWRGQRDNAGDGCSRGQIGAEHPRLLEFRACRGRHRPR